MKQVTFNDIYILSNALEENELFIHYHYPEMPNRYDSNFIAFKCMPSLLDFQDIVSYLKTFHEERRQSYVNFHFPADASLPKGLVNYLRYEGYDISIIELYVINPDHFITVQAKEEIKIRTATKDNLSLLLDLQYEDNIQFGKKFATEQAALTQRQFENKAIEKVLAFYKGELVGYVELIQTDKTVEINDLTVLERYRHRGIGSHLQKYAMDKAKDKKVILIADGEDTPREMYRRQNYTYVGFRYEALKLYGTAW